MKARVLFVDDEPQLLEALRNRFAHRRQPWEMVFAGSGHEALELLAGERFVAIVSDLRMPGMDGSALLRRVRELYPAVARIAFSGPAEEAALLQTMATAHQLLPKTCDPGLLENAIDRVCRTRELVSGEALRETIGRLGSLPSPPAVYMALLDTLTDARSHPRDVARIVERDGALAAQMLRIANSAYFGMTRPVVSIREAVIFLGLGTVRQLALAAEVFRAMRAAPPFPEWSVERLQEHAIYTAGIASALFASRDQKEAAFAAGLLHDLGRLLLVAALPEVVHAACSETKSGGESLLAIERRLLGATHAQIGAYLLDLWNLPFPIVEGVAHHHSPARVEGNAGLNLVSAVHVADVLAHEATDSGEDRARFSGADLDATHLDRMGLSPMLPEWRELARKVIAAAASALK